MKKLPELHLVRGSQAAVASNVIHLTAIRRSWPLQHAWRDLVRSLIRKPTP